MRQEALTRGGSKVFERLRPAGFILGGGTGLALQLGHRVSEDFDFFGEKEIALGLLGEVEKCLADIDLPLRIAVNNKDELTVFAGETKITFLCYPFPVLLSPVPLGQISAFRVLEIAAMKAYTLGRRGTFKDYIDLYFIVKNGEILKSIAELAEKKYDEAFDTRLFLEQIVYMEDVEEEPIRFLKEPVTKGELQKFFEKQVEKFPV